LGLVSFLDCKLFLNFLTRGESGILMGSSL
jgi:hypothetical protein